MKAFHFYASSLPCLITGTGKVARHRKGWGVGSRKKGERRKCQKKEGLEEEEKGGGEGVSTRNKRNGKKTKKKR